jgi:hypothetical protein
MTEQEAKRKWCPLVRVFETKDGEQWNNRPDSGFVSDAYCIGSACMAWRWLPRGHDMRGGPVAIVKALKKPEPPANPHHYWLAENPIQETWGRFEDTGYCGLAGMP